MAKITVVGSVNMDLVVSVPHHPRPGETVLGGDVRTFPGGKGANQAVAAARDGLGPSLVEALVYRYGAHSNADDDRRYRPADEVTAWKARDPIARLRRYLEGRRLWSDADEAALAAELEAELDAAVAAGEAAGDPPDEWMFDDVLARPSTQLRKQRAAWRRDREA